MAELEIILNCLVKIFGFKNFLAQQVLEPKYFGPKICLNSIGLKKNVQNSLEQMFHFTLNLVGLKLWFLTKHLTNQPVIRLLNHTINATTKQKQM